MTPNAKVVIASAEEMKTTVQKGDEVTAQTFISELRHLHHNSAGFQEVTKCTLNRRICIEKESGEQFVLKEELDKKGSLITCPYLEKLKNYKLQTWSLISFQNLNLLLII